ncbi:MAG: Ras-related protein Rab-35 [Hyperionvirus sp.]|uniref:Ras-related protein Rab-35 n=1 Tax=Hyperionvirus sp. TaxID=2487770 RepID=A0A3G5AC65_9VIRU|nr:MAG: Ras-related protein Rab-35 [Hyperionvirus sp.]
MGNREGVVEKINVSPKLQPDRMEEIVRVERRRVYKVLFVGGKAGGKTSIISAMLDNVYDENVEATIGLDLRIKVRGRNKYQIWEICGDAKYEKMALPYFGKVHTVVVVYSLCCLESFLNVSLYLRDSMDRDLCVIVVGNKSEEAGVVSEKARDTLILDNDVHYIEVSAKCGVGIDGLLGLITKFSRYEMEEKIEKEID